MDCCGPIVIKRVENCDDTCCEPSGLQRRFVTKGEELEKLENYRDQLKKELEGLDEHLQEMKKK